MMRRGGRDTGTFSGDFSPPYPWRTFAIRMKDGTTTTDRSIGALADLELHWIARVVAAELEQRYKTQRAAKKNGHVAV